MPTRTTRHTAQFVKAPAGVVDSGTLSLKFTPSAPVEVGPTSDAVTARLSLTPSTSVEVYSQVLADVGTVLFRLVPSVVEIIAHAYLDSAQVYLDFTPSADDHYCPGKVEFEGDMNVRWVAGLQGRLQSQFEGSRWESQFLGVGAGYNC